MKWAIGVGGAPVVLALRTAVAEACAALACDGQPGGTKTRPDDAWHHHGRLGVEELRAIRLHGLGEVVRPCLDALAAAPTAGARAVSMS
ncbi:MAG TPA: hypothetical protein VFZ53_21430 [Polyangiaceae bacterium]